MNPHSDHTTFVGASFAVVTALIPDSFIDLGTKLLLAVLTAFLTGIAYRAGGALYDKFSGKKLP